MFDMGNPLASGPSVVVTVESTSVPRRRKGSRVLLCPMTADRPTLIRAMGRWALTAAVVNSVIGSGVFGLPSALAGFAGEWSPVTVLIAGAGIFVIVLCFAEVGSRFEDPGAPTSTPAKRSVMLSDSRWDGSTSALVSSRQRLSSMF